jgi:HAE1 family hydrophobic/amphiphilic exporter-1
LKVGDVAEVKYEVRKRTWNQRINGRPGLLLGIFKESLANTVALSHQLETVLESQILKQPVMRHAEVNFLFVQGQFIEDANDNLRDTGLWGGIFAILILMFFLRNIRMTIIMMFAIPLSILMSLMVVYFIGWTLNIFVMMGLMISIGMVVDNGIVVLENIYHKRNNGLSPGEASIGGASEVNLAIILATLTTIIVFISMILIEDRSGGLKFYLQRIGLPVIFSLLASLFVALVLIPLATSKLGGHKQATENKIIARTKAYYNTMLSWALNHRLDAVIGMLLIIVLTGLLAQKTPQSDQQGGAINDIWLIFDLPNNLGTEETNKFFSAVEDTIYAHAEEYDLKAVDTGFRQGFGRIRMFLHPPPQEQWFTVVYRGITKGLGLNNDIKMSRDEVLEDIKDRIPQKPGVKFRTDWHGGGGDEEGTVSIMLYGDDTGKLAQLAEEVERRMRLLDGVISVETDREAGADEIRISMDREVVTRNGLNPNQVAYTLMYAVRGLNLPRFQAMDKEIEMRVQLKEEDRESLGQVKNITFINSQGRAIPLSAVANFTIDKGFGQIARENGKTFLAVKAKTLTDDLPKISAQIDRLMKDFPLPYGYNWQKGSRFEQFDEDMQNFVNALIIAFVFVYLIMAILFESFVLPWSIMFAIPLAFFGAFLALFGTGTPLDIMGIIGMIILVGVVVNNGIVLIDMVNRRRREGYGRIEAILDAGQNRFRPIMMTSFTTIGGLIPMAVGNANLIGMPYAPIGRVLIGGLLTSTFGTLLIVPVFYTLFEDLALFMQRVVRWFRRKDEEGETAYATEK